MGENKVITQFVENYRANLSEYERVAAQVESTLKKRKKASGLMAIITARAKDPVRLLEKLVRKDAERIAKGKPPFQSEDEINATIHDLVGARIALYFPGDAPQVANLLTQEFVPTRKVKAFPPLVPNHQEVMAQNCTAHMRKIYPGYDNRRFDGYHAVHHYVRFAKPLSTGIPNPEIEIQVASVLMYAWSEVEHDLAYKKMMGNVSREEYEVLDEINGLVIAGEIALNRLNQLSNQRIETTQPKSHFETPFMLLTYLKSWYLRRQGLEPAEYVQYEEEDGEGNVNQLFGLYKALDMLQRDQVDKELKRLGTELPKTFSQLIDRLGDQISERNKQKSKMWIAKNVMLNQDEDSSFYTNAKIGSFIGKWNALEELVRKTLRAQGYKGSNSKLTWEYVVEKRVFPDHLCELYHMLRLERNKIVHGNRVPDEARFLKLEGEMDRFMEMLKAEYGV